MPRTGSSNSNAAGGPYAAPRPRPNWVAATLFALLGLYLFAALFDYRPAQVPWFSTNPVGHNMAGSVGAILCWAGLYVLGAAMWLVPAMLLWFSYVAVRSARRLTAGKIVAAPVCLIAASGLAAMLVYSTPTDYFPRGCGGILGRVVYDHFLQGLLGDFGTFLVLVPVYAFSLLFIVTKDLGGEIERMLGDFSAWRDARAERRAALRQTARARARNRKAAGAAERGSEGPVRPPLVLEPVGPASKNVLVPKSAAVSMPALAAPKAAPRTPPAGSPTEKEKLSAGKLELNIVKPEEPRKARSAAPAPADDRYHFPPLSLLKDQIRVSARTGEDEHRANAENLLRILGEFGVEVTLGEIHVGPVITRYEVVPAAGVRVEKISGLDKNIALGMRAQSVRILAPIPGKAAVGVEVPNQHPTPVGLREILESEDWVGAKAEIPIALGKDVSGKPLISDLTKMPHLLIAGATGSGKSVCLNVIIASILYSKSPNEVRLVMVDPKVVELKTFNVLPHMLIPVLTEPKKVPGALKWLLSEMEQRYRIFAKCNVRNIVGFNERRRDAEPPAPAQPSLEGLDPRDGGDALTIPDRLPYFVVIIDELADLMMVAPAEVEAGIAR
ncbi:MAG: DNA translocase FtsK 4TM domain-containing protein, partial [Opitutaceae bacterium]